jgi:hypothetical protein
MQAVIITAASDLLPGRVINVWCLGLQAQDVVAAQRRRPTTGTHSMNLATRKKAPGEGCSGVLLFIIDGTNQLLWLSTSAPHPHS